MNVARTAAAVVAARLLLNSRGPRTSRRPCRFFALKATAPPTTTTTVTAVRRRDYDGGSSPEHGESFNDRAQVPGAQQIVGRHTDLGRPTSDEVADDVTSRPRPMAGSDHPLLKTAESLRLYDTPRDLRAWRRVVLLVSEAAGRSHADSSAEEDGRRMLRGQLRTLAEVAEMMRISHLMHNGIVDVRQAPFPGRPARDDAGFGNKIALLGGDYLMAYSSRALSALKNPDLTELIWSGLRDLTEAAFVGRRDAQNNPLPSPFRALDPPPGPSRFRFDPFQPSGPPGSTPPTPALRDWTRRHVLSAGSLLGKSCQGALLLAGHGERLQEQGFLFGKHLSLAWQACLDLEPFQSGKPYSLGFSFKLYSAPIMFHLEHDSSLFEEIDKGVNSIQDVDYVKIHDIVMNGPGIDHTKKLQKEHSQKALEVLDVFEENDARTALSNIIMAMDRE